MIFCEKNRIPGSTLSSSSPHAGRCTSLCRSNPSKGKWSSSTTTMPHLKKSKPMVYSVECVLSWLLCYTSIMTSLASSTAPASPPSSSSSAHWGSTRPSQPPSGGQSHLKMELVEFFVTFRTLTPSTHPLSQWMPGQEDSRSHMQQTRTHIVKHLSDTFTPLPFIAPVRLGWSCQPWCCKQSIWRTKLEPVPHKFKFFFLSAPATVIWVLENTFGCAVKVLRHFH